MHIVYLSDEWHKELWMPFRKRNKNMRDRIFSNILLIRVVSYFVILLRSVILFDLVYSKLINQLTTKQIKTE